MTAFSYEDLPIMAIGLHLVGLVNFDRDGGWTPPRFSLAPPKNPISMIGFFVINVARFGLTNGCSNSHIH